MLTLSASGGWLAVRESPRERAAAVGSGPDLSGLAAPQRARQVDSEGPDNMKRLAMLRVMVAAGAFGGPVPMPAPDTPFFVYYATGATHSPDRVAPERVAKWRGPGDQGWDRLREETLARQMEVYAAYLDMTDSEIGRVAKALEIVNALDNTLIF